MTRPENDARVVPRPADMMFVLGMESAAMLLDEEVYSANKLIEEAAAKGDSHAKMRMWAIRDAMQTMARSIRHFASDAAWRASVMNEPASATLHLRVAELEGQIRELNPGLLPVEVSNGRVPPLGICIYCGFETGREVEDAAAQIIDHHKVCPKNPWRAALAELVRQIDEFAKENGEANFYTGDAARLLGDPEIAHITARPRSLESAPVVPRPAAWDADLDCIEARQRGGKGPICVECNNGNDEKCLWVARARESRAPKMDMKAGWRLVPVAPTHQMILAAQKASAAGCVDTGIWSAMLAAAPFPPASAPKVLEQDEQVRTIPPGILRDARRYRHVREFPDIVLFYARDRSQSIYTLSKREQLDRDIDAELAGVTSEERQR